jgi:hypothetical protein
MHSSPVGQVPHEPPQPSSPQVLLVQSGVQELSSQRADALQE